MKHEKPKPNSADATRLQVDEIVEHYLPPGLIPDAGNMVEEITHRTTLSDICGPMGIALARIEEAINSDMADEDKDTLIALAWSEVEAAKVPLEEKLRDIHYARTSTLGEIAAIRTEEKRLADKRRRLEAKNDRFDSYVKRCLDGIGRFKTALYSVWLQKNPPRLVIDDESAIPSPRKEPELWVNHAPTPNAAEIKKRIQAGEQIGGCRVEQSEGLRWR